MAAPSAYPITAPIPPHVAAEGGPNKIQAPSAEAIKLEVNENISAEMFKKQQNKPVVGKLMIGGKKFDVTFQELDQIQRTLQAAKEVVNKRYKLGFMR